MFVDFNKVFRKKEQSPQTKIPSRYLDFLSKDLPDGMKYVLNNKGECVIESDTETVTISGFRPAPTPEQLTVLGKNFSYQEMLEYMYNSQESIPLTLDKKGHIILNGKSIAIEQLSFNPFNPIHFVDGSVFIAPGPLPDPFTITVSSEDYSRELLVKRVSNKSIQEKKFESIGDEPIKVNYTIDDKSRNLQLTISLRLKNAKSVKDIVSSISIYNSFVRGEGFINGNRISHNSLCDESKLFDCETFYFWEKTLKIETILGLSFQVPQSEVSFEEICEIERLYQNLVNKVPTREMQTIDSLTGEWRFNGDEDKFPDEAPILLCFDATAQIELFKEKLSLSMYLMIVNATIKEMKDMKSATKIILGDASNEKRRYTSSMVFRSVAEKDDFINSNKEELFKLFSEAKRPQDYLQQENRAGQ